jgi:hypothetical protein
MAATNDGCAQTMPIGLEVPSRLGLSTGHRFALKWPDHMPSCDEPDGCPWGFVKHTIGISRGDLTRDCLQQLRMWPGCERVEGVAVLGDLRGGFAVHVIDYGLAKKKVADRALRCIQREKLRRYHLKVE